MCVIQLYYCDIEQNVLKTKYDTTQLDPDIDDTPNVTQFNDVKVGSAVKGW